MDIVTHWRLKEARYRFAGMFCPTCGARNIAHRPICPGCGFQAEKTSQSGIFKSEQIDLKALALLSKA